MSASRIEAVQTPVIPVVARWVAETPGTISLGQGIVSYGPPPEAIEAMQRFGRSEADHLYGPVEGLPALVDALEAKLARENGIDLRPTSRVVVTAGGNMAFVNAVLALTDPGDEIILPLPYYFNHEMAVTMASARPVPVRTTAEYQLDVEAIARAITRRTRAVVTVSPNNPSGAIYPEADLRAVNALCRERGLVHVHDEAYEYFTYGTRPFSPGSIDGAGAHTISLFSFSKAYGMASWRLGYMVAPETLWSALNKIQDTVLICPPAVSQRAGLAALAVGQSWTASHLPSLDAMRVKIFGALADPEVPCDVPAQGGAFYCFFRVHTPADPLELTEWLIRRHRVAVIPGSAFGAVDGCYLRVSYGALDPATADEGIRRLVTGLRGSGLFSTESG
jgi:aspartate/methionine/tyrosine aminotransferase